ncbi:PREDICTED: uncharacterized protein LOC105146380 [Acromyrmex echinatior]|uniref:uncharacterized protein LOC105146380 n=1 Tax=Acromyrmex echinatior TaxID=103372 RepID=UPI000580ECB3|nr:PREDICTED: uncharacterized protein LOC105146380 [Acromyrmex echinatior]XP_011054887.1 PREDICTED: uncharacterized protein LOC105146380 [Acromyrmex echinatior]XP_011054888.1 PREDICTED: uncharacterized protein LOC105146380 [Acromyrmex echinatior]
MTEITFPKVHRQSSQDTLSPMRVDISKKKKKSKDKLSLILQNRQPQQIQSETSTKKKRLSFENAATRIELIASLEDVAISSELSLKETTMLIPSQQTQPGIELESVHSSYLIKTNWKQSKIIDRNIALTDKQLWKWRRDAKIHCKQLDKATGHLTSARNLFKQPSYSPKRWNTNLRNLFADHMITPQVTIYECRQGCHTCWIYTIPKKQCV